MEIVRTALAALNRGGDLDAAFKDAAPDAEVDLTRAVGPTCHTRVHYADDGEEWNETLKAKLEQLEG